MKLLVLDDYKKFSTEMQNELLDICIEYDGGNKIQPVIAFIKLFGLKMSPENIAPTKQRIEELIKML